IGMETTERTVGAENSINVVMTVSSENILDEVVVTALGIKREKKSLGYATQQVSSEDIGSAKEGSFISSLSGKVSGVHIKKPGQMGGSANIIIRGSNSISASNQALFVVDGVPVSNSTLNSRDAMTNRGGYDYGNAASDIDPESIESVSVLKGAAAAALYGSEASNGVVLITTKKGKAQKGLGVTVNQTLITSQIDKSTFPEYQNEYGAGYGPFYGSTGWFDEADFDGDGVDDLMVPFGEDASYGGALDGTMVYQWNSLFPELDTYGQKTPYLPVSNGPASIFKAGLSSITSVSVDGGNENGTFRLGYTYNDREGILPNSKMTTNTIDVGGAYHFNNKLHVDAKVVYTDRGAKGRYGTGYDGGNSLQSLRQWFQVNVDLKEQEDAYLQTLKNVTWNVNNYQDTRPHYFDNPYWNLYENYQTDERNRVFSKLQATYDFTDNFNFLARFGVDAYSDLQEERTAIGSLDLSQYKKYQRTFEQYNSDFIFNYDTELSDNVDLRALMGMGIKRNRIKSTDASTNGGLVIPRVYALDNSADNLQPPGEYDATSLKYGLYAQASLNLYNLMFAEASVRRDESSTLPEGNNIYYYPSGSLSFIFSELLDADWLDLGKLRGGYAAVAGDTEPYRVLNTFSANPVFDGAPMYFVDDTSKNPDLVPEKTTELEAGLELSLFKNRLGLDLSVYEKNTIDLITAVQVSTGTGFNFKWVNAGTMSNKGIELALNAKPIKTDNFKWNMQVNWAKNKNEVVELFGDSENILLYSAWNTSVNARVGLPFGAITGYDFVYDDDGNKLVGSDGRYLRNNNDSSAIIGNIQPDWNGGLTNNFSYKNFNLGFLIDVQFGGDIYNVDYAFGLATGLYAETVGLNDLGNPVRDPLTEDGTSGGIILDGVLGTVEVDDDGNYIYTSSGVQNDIRIPGYYYRNAEGFYGGSGDNGTSRLAEKAHVFDASYVKLREVTFGYDINSNQLRKVPFNQISLGVFGRNLWIIHKNLPYGDPEYAASAGNFQGIQNGALPSVKEYGLNVKFKF
ncbi:MAG: SusC/RagA family TonB-linked outer membrane protein, partial [Bacteroidota bacterium]